MSNWQNPSFNLDAPEFVPKFGGPSPNQNRNMPPQQQSQQYAPPGTVPGGYPAPQMPPFNQLSPQQQQQLYRQSQYNNYQQQQFQNFNQPPPQQFYYQQQQQQQPPQQQQQQQPSQQNTNNTSDKQVNQVANNLSKLTTNDAKTETPVANNSAPAPAPSNPTPVVAPEQVKVVESNEAKPKLQVPGNSNSFNIYN